MSLLEPNLPDSPFLPGTTLQYAWDSVSLTAALACWRRYRYSIIEGLVPKGPGRAIALDFGIAFHKALEHYHVARAQGEPHDEATATTVSNLTADPHYANLPTHEDLAAEAEETPDDDDGIHARNAKVRTRYHLMRAVIWYLDHYADDPAQTLLLASGEPAVELSFRVELPLHIGGVENVLLCGHIDRGVEFNGHIYVADYKTTKSLSRQFFADFELSHQITGYTLAGGIIFNKPLRGALIDGIALQVGGVQFARHPANRTEGQITEYLSTVQHVIDGAERAHDEDSYPMNTSACYFCQYKELCKQPPEFREQYKKMLYDVKPAWNPLENR